MVVYIPPRANTKLHVHDTISKQQNAHLDIAFVITGDFNQTNPRTVLPRLYQHVKCTTMGKNTLDDVYTNLKDTYRAIRCALSQAIRPLFVSHLGTQSPC